MLVSRDFDRLGSFPVNYKRKKENWRLNKIGDSGVKQSFWRIVGARTIAAPRIGGRDNEEGKVSL